MTLKWARFGPNEEIHITEDFSNLTLDTIALCTMDYRFNSFYRDGAHPYVAAMNKVLGQAGAGAGLASIPVIGAAISVFGRRPEVTKEEAEHGLQLMNQIGQDIIDTRRSNDTRKNDFLDMLLFGKDPKTGEAMRDELITAQMSSFLVAGHETTSGLLSFTVIKLLQNPETYQRAQEEVDRVVGEESITIKHIRELKYIYAALQETLRLIPSAPFISKFPHPDRKNEVTVLGGRYKVEPGTRVQLLLSKCMTDPQVWGSDAREYKPSRMLETDPDYPRIEKYWRPFSEGSRSCLGRGFSIQEAVLALALILQNFDLRLSDPMYKMRIKHTITVKPLGLSCYASLRHGMTVQDVEARLHGETTVGRKGKSTTSAHNGIKGTGDGKPITILYGSNTGTCLALAQRLASELLSQGYSPQVMEMDAAVGQLKPDSTTIVVTPSYEGQPPDNALHFVQNLEDIQLDSLNGVKFAVFGCGHKDWHETHHRIPKLVDCLMQRRGAQRVAEIGLSDVSQGNPMADFETWLDKSLLPALSLEGGTAISDAVDIEAEVSTGERTALLHQDLDVGTVKTVEVLTAKGEQPEKRQVEIELPPGSAYECGDYLAILPQSPEFNVRAVMTHFKLPDDATITLKSKTFSPLPLGTSLSVVDVLKNYYELAKPATRRGLILAQKHTTDSAIREKLSTWLDDEEEFRKNITEAHTSIFELLKTHPQIQMPFAAFLSCLPPLGIRQYSISSSPLADAGKCTLTYGVVTDEKDPLRPFYGVASNYLASLSPGARIQVATRRTAKQSFRLPLDSANTPILMFAAGTGMAPFRGFIEQRAVQLEANSNTQLAPAYLFFGCRHSDRDRLYAREMDAWEKLGVVKIYYAFSQESEKSAGCKHIADRMMEEMDIISEAWQAGARFYTCGSRAVAMSVKDAARKIVDHRMHQRKADGWTNERIKARKEEIFRSFSERAADDVFD